MRVVSTKFALDKFPQSMPRSLAQKIHKGNLCHGEETRTIVRFPLLLPFMKFTTYITAFFLSLAVVITSFGVAVNHTKSNTLLAYNLHGKFLYINHQSRRLLRQSVEQTVPEWHVTEIV